MPAGMFLCPHMWTILLMLANFPRLASAETGQNVSNSSPSAEFGMATGARPPIQVNVMSNIGRPGAVLYSLESEYTLKMNYTLRCVSHDTLYMLIAKTSAENVALITSVPVFNISCANAQPIHFNETANLNTYDDLSLEPLSTTDTPDRLPNFVGVVQGELNVTIRTSMIGRSFFLVLANKLRGPDLPDLENTVSSVPVSISGGSGPSYDAVASKHEANDSYIESEGEQGEGQGQGHQGHALGPGQGQGMMPGMPPGMPPNTVGMAMIIVMQLPRTIDQVFRIILYIVIIGATTGMGIKVDLPVVKEVLKKPVAPIIGLICQYLCMPLIAYGVAKLVPQDSAAISLGIFACGVVPGGGMSNMFTYLLGGDLSLSVAMTTVSNIASLGLLPLWIFTLGSSFKDDTIELKVPYEKILETLAIVILPLFLGIIIQYKLPKVAKIIVKVLKPVLIVVVVFLITLGIYTNFFIFRMIRPMTITAGCLLPYIGYVIGGSVALVCCQTWARVKTIAIETGIQNTGIAFLLLFLSLPPPDNQLAAVAPASSAIMTPLPPFLAVLCYIFYNKCIKKKKPNEKEDEANENGFENGNVKKEKSSKKEILRNLAHGKGTAAIIVCWRKITNSGPEENVPEKMMNKEFEVQPPEKENLMERHSNV